jgi:putative peptidoglycan lipid II flippase
LISRSIFIKQSLFTATVITVGGNVLGRILGFVREAYFASYFGTSGIFDTFIIAFTVPELIGMILFSSMPVAMIPLIKQEQSGQKDSEKFWSGLIWFSAAFAILSLLFYLCRNKIIYFLAPNLTGEMFDLADELSGILSVFILFRGIEIYFRSWCFQKKHFLSPAVSTIIVNVTIILSLVLLYDIFYIKALAYGWIICSFLSLLFNGYFAYKVVRPGFGFSLDTKWSLALVHSLMTVSIIECISMSYALVDRYFAGHYLGPGPISALRYASTLISIPGGVFIAAFNVASFPWIAQYFQEGRTDELKQIYIKTIKNLFFFIGFAALGIIIFAQDIIRVALHRGAFDETSLALTVTPLIIYAFGVTFQGIYTFQMRFYFASRRLIRLGAILTTMLAIKILVSYLLIDSDGHEGLALSSTVAIICGFLIMSFDTFKQLHIKSLRKFLPFMTKSLGILAIVAVCWIGLNSLWPSGTADSILRVFLKLSLYAAGGFFVLFLLGKVSRHEEAIDLYKKLFGVNKQS